MREPLEIGPHWAIIDTEKALGQRHGWVARWAVYPDRDSACHDPGLQRASLVSGSTALFPSREDAYARALLDASRTGSVISGTYRDNAAPDDTGA